MIKNVVIGLLVIVVAVMAYMQMKPKKNRLQQASAYFDAQEAEERSERAKRDTERARREASERAEAENYRLSSKYRLVDYRREFCVDGNVCNYTVVCENGKGERIDTRITTSFDGYQYYLSGYGNFGSVSGAASAVCSK